MGNKINDMDAKTIVLLASINEIIRMPRLSERLNVVTLSRWHKNIGDYIEMGDTIAELETDNSVMELECYNTGVLLYKGVENEGVLRVGEILAVIGKY